MAFSRLGLIGVGAMGRPMGANLIKNGYRLTVYDIRKDAMNSLEKMGASNAASPREVALNSQAIITSLPSSPNVKEAILGKNGVIEGIRKGTVLIEMSSIDPNTIIDVNKALHAHGAEVIDAPVSGTPPIAEKAALTIMVAGRKQTINRCKGILGALGKKIIYVGDVGSGKTAKLGNNLLVVLNAVAAVEVLNWVSKTNLDPRLFHSVIKTTLANSAQVDLLYPNIFRKRFSTGGTLWNLEKDLVLALQVALNLNAPMPATALAAQIVRSAMCLGFTRESAESLMKVYWTMSGRKAKTGYDKAHKSYY